MFECYSEYANVANVEMSDCVFFLHVTNKVRRWNSQSYVCFSGIKLFFMPNEVEIYGEYASV